MDETASKKGHHTRQLDTHVADQIWQALPPIGDLGTAAYINTDQIPQRRTVLHWQSHASLVGLASLAQRERSFANDYLKR